MRFKKGSKPDVWKQVQAHMANPKEYIEKIKNVELDSLRDVKMKNLREALKTEEWDVENVKSKSSAVAEIVTCLKILSAVHVIHQKLGPDSPAKSPKKEEKAPKEKKAKAVKPSRALPEESKEPMSPTSDGGVEEADEVLKHCAKLMEGLKRREINELASLEVPPESTK